METLHVAMTVTVLAFIGFVTLQLRPYCSLPPSVPVSVCPSVRLSIYLSAGVR